MKEDNLKTVRDKFNQEIKREGVIICPFSSPFILSEECSSCSDGMVYIVEDR